MDKYMPKEFTIPELDGISRKAIEEHLKLYQGYVKNTNHILELLESPADHDSYAFKEAQHHLGFEFDGMRNHEYYFGSFVGGAKELPDSALAKKIIATFGSIDKWREYFQDSLATTRGIGWAMLGLDTHTDQLINYWVDEQHLGHLTGVQPLVALDMWEHSYLFDYTPGEKGQYIDAFFRNLNWETVARWYDEAAQ
jgi:Fe-Mn family superoxide dismutase